MDESIRKKDIEQYLGEKFKELSNEQRRNTIYTIEFLDKKIDKSSSKIIATIFSESRKIREEIGYQTMMLQMLEDNISEIQFDEETGVTSRIEVSVGAEVFGTGAKWILDIDTAKASYSELLQAVQRTPSIPNKIKEKAGLILKKIKR